MNPSWVPYRKATIAGRCYVAGACELPALREAVAAAIENIERWATSPDESLTALRIWRDMIAQAESGSITESQLAERETGVRVHSQSWRSVRPAASILIRVMGSSQEK